MTGFGWKKDDFNPQAVYHKPRIIKLPTYIDLSSYNPSVRDQGTVGSCTGFGIGGILVGTAKQNADFSEWYSPEWIYNGARFLEGDLDQDAGAMPDDCFTWLDVNGCLLEHFWPYDPSSVDTSSPVSREPEAIKYPSFTVFRVDNGSAGIMSALAEGHFVAIGVPWFAAWMDAPNGDLPVAKATDAIAGGHMVFFYGYDSVRGVFFGQNSWGTSWGNNGRFTMPMSMFDGVFQAARGYDAHYVTWALGPVPPTPPPTRTHFWTRFCNWLKQY